MKKWHTHVVPVFCLALIIAVTGLAAWHRGVGLGWWPGFAAGLSVAVYAGVEMFYAFLRRERQEFTRLQKHYDVAVRHYEQENAVLVSVATEAERWQSDYLNFLWHVKHLLQDHEAYLLQHPQEAVAAMRKLVREAEAGLKK